MPSFPCFSCHSNLDVELRESVVATIAASNVLQSSACLSQEPRRLEGRTEYHKECIKRSTRTQATP